MRNESVLWLLVVALLVMVPLFTACAGQAPTPSPTPSPAPELTPAPEPAPTGEPTAIPHTLEGRDDCLMCHTSGAHAIPIDHAGRTNDICTVCHQPAG
jgi:hypothetical protein